MRMMKGAEKAKRRPHTVDTVIALVIIVILARIITIGIIIILAPIMTSIINDNLIKTNKAKQEVKDEQPVFCLALRGKRKMSCS